jgi:hypothetical protein
MPAKNEVNPRKSVADKNRQRPRREGANAGASDQAKKLTASQTKTLS